MAQRSSSFYNTNNDKIKAKCESIFNCGTGKYYNMIKENMIDKIAPYSTIASIFTDAKFNGILDNQNDWSPLIRKIALRHMHSSICWDMRGNILLGDNWKNNYKPVVNLFFPIQIHTTNDNGNLNWKPSECDSNNLNRDKEINHIFCFRYIVFCLYCIKLYSKEFNDTDGCSFESFESKDYFNINLCSLLAETLRVVYNIVEDFDVTITENSESIIIKFVNDINIPDMFEKLITLMSPIKFDIIDSDSES